MIRFYHWFLGLRDVTMECPKPYGLFHLCFLVFGLVAVVCLAWKLRNLGEKGNRRLFVGISVTLLMLEVCKQFLFAIDLTGGGYAWYLFPFQLCSVPMYLCLIAAFTKRPGVKRGIYSFLVFYNLLGGFMALAEPSGVFNESVFLCVHSMLWHLSLVFIGVYIILSGRCTGSKEEYRDATFSYLFIAVAALLFNMTVKLFNGFDTGMNMFFVGPEVSSILVFHEIGESCGWYVGTIVYLFATCLGAFLISLGVRALRNTLRVGVFHRVR